MIFLSNGDFNFPFDWHLYWVKHYYMWSFQTGAPNPDGIIRFPGRIFNFLVFGLFGNIAVGYFYIFSTLIVAFLAFYYFSKVFLEIQRRSVCVVGALFFALNPIFLGNLAKIGLVLAVAMLPLSLIAIQAAFKRKRWRYLLWAVLCLNISLIHPYTFSVNLLVSALYLLYLARRDRQSIGFIKNWPKFAVIGAVAIGLNAYLILPIASMGTVSKDVISSNVTPIHADYTALVDVSNTGNILTGLSLSKNVFLDFSFYNHAYRAPYLIGSFLFYIILISLYLLVGNKLKRLEQRQFILFSVSFLLLVMLATVNFLHFDKLIKLLINLPGGWAFRSPLKWQLYIPMALAGSLVLLLNRVSSPRWRLMVQSSLLITFILMSGYVGFDVYKMILTPRHLTSFAALQSMPLDQKTLLYVNSTTCQKLMPYNSTKITELNQVFASKNVQVKRVWEDNVDTINLGSYDYVMQCSGHADSQLTDSYDFKLSHTFIGGSMQLYANKQAAPAVYALSDVFSLTNPDAIAQKYNFVTKDLKLPFAFLPAANNNPPTSTLTDLFESFHRQTMKPGQITNTSQLGAGKSTLSVRAGDTPVYDSTTDQALSLSPNARPGTQLLAAKNLPASLSLKNTGSLTANYLDPVFNYRNLVKNPSLESGLWQKKVADCFAYDNQPAIAMRVVTSDHTDGRQALELEATKHIACTGPGSIFVRPGEHYLIDFDYRGLKAGTAGYYVGFDNSGQPAINERLQTAGSGWHHFSKVITVPTNAYKLRLLLYGYPSNGVKTAITRYDQVGVFKVPPIQNRFYVVSRPSTAMKQPKKVEFVITNPTKKVITVSGATEPFYLATNDSYHKLWQLQPVHVRSKPWSRNVTVLTGTQHVAINGTMNGWFIDPQKLCTAQPSSCTKQADGSYNISLVITFVPQHWFYMGLVVSGVTLLGCAGYLVLSRKQTQAIWRSRP